MIFFCNYILTEGSSTNYVQSLTNDFCADNDFFKTQRKQYSLTIFIKNFTIQVVKATIPQLSIVPWWNEKKFAHQGVLQRSQLISKSPSRPSYFVQCNEHQGKARVNHHSSKKWNLNFFISSINYPLSCSSTRLNGVLIRNAEMKWRKRERKRGTSLEYLIMKEEDL